MNKNKPKIKISPPGVRFARTLRELNEQLYGKKSDQNQGQRKD